MYLIRLDDASDYMDIEKWNRMELLLEKCEIKPIVGIIPENKDEELLKYKKDNAFWNKALKWQDKNWIIAMHGYQHLYVSDKGGINPIHNRSEFAGVSLKEQKEKIKKGYKIMVNKGLNPIMFFAPSHTFDKNTMIALKEETSIRIISDTIANDIYFENEFYFVPQQSGAVRNLPFKVTTFCYHPNMMNDTDFIKLEEFIKRNKEEFKELGKEAFYKRKKSAYDKLLNIIYFMKKKVRL